MPRPFRPLLAAAALFATLSSAKTAPTESVIFNFHLRDGIGQPTGRLTLGPDGSLYGVAGSGGNTTNCQNGCGSIYKLTPPTGKAKLWTGTILYAFPDAGGFFVDGTLLLAPDGSLYGVNSLDPSPYNGSVFKLTPPASGSGSWTYQMIYQFGGSPDGESPNGGVVMDGNGALYGVTQMGGAANDGTVFKLTPPASGPTQWTEAVIHSFDDTLQQPFGPLVRNAVGGLYGIAYTFRGRSTYTSLFVAGPTAESMFTNLYTFAPSNKYLLEAPVTLGLKGVIYGNAPVRAAAPTCGAGPPKSCGAVFALSATTPRKISYPETFADPLAGILPEGGLLLGPGGILYGATRFGGAGADQSGGNGTVYSLTPPSGSATSWTKTVLYRFAGSPDGQGPRFGLARDKTGVLYGVTVGGGSVSQGVAFKVVP